MLPRNILRGLRSNSSKRRTAVMTAANSIGQHAEVSANYAKPHINVTPLVDVLLVVLIIFMVVSPMKPARFLVKVPSQPDLDVPFETHIHALLVTIKPDRSLMLNGLTDMGSVNYTTKLTTMLVDLFQKRLKNHPYSDQLRNLFVLPQE